MKVKQILYKGLAGVLLVDDFNFAISLGGDLSTEPAQYLEQEIFNMIRESDNTNKPIKFDYFLDLEKLGFLSSTAQGLVIALNVNKHKTLGIYTPHKKHRRLLEIVGIEPCTDEKSEIHFYDSLRQIKSKLSPVAAHILDARRALLPKGSAYTGKHLEVLEWALKLEHDKVVRGMLEEELRNMDINGYLADALYGDQINVPSDRKYAVCSYLYMLRAFKKAGADILEDDIAYIVRELTQNSFEHGYNKSKNGIINVISETETNEKQKKIILSFIDYGTGIEEASQHAHRRFAFFGKAQIKTGGKGRKTLTEMLNRIGGKFTLVSGASLIQEGSKTDELRKKLDLCKPRDVKLGNKTVAKGTTALIEIPIKVTLDNAIEEFFIVDNK